MSGGHNRIKGNTNNCLSLDVLYLQRQGVLKDSKRYYFPLTWTDKRTGQERGNVSLYTTPDYIELEYRTTDTVTGEKKEHDYKVYIDWTPCNYGGQRAWFVCPECGENFRKLYFKRGVFLCRKCHNLNYYSQQISKRDQAMDGIRERIYHVQKQLQSECDPFSSWAPRPKGMHMSRYSRLLQKLRNLQDEYTKQFVAIAGNMLKDECWM